MRHPEVAHFWSSQFKFFESGYIGIGREKPLARHLVEGNRVKVARWHGWPGVDKRVNGGICPAVSGWMKRINFGV